MRFTSARCAMRATDRAPIVLPIEVFSAFLNVDDIDHNRLNLKLLSIDRFNLFSFRRRDHGAKTAGAEDGKLRPFIEELLAEAGLAAPEQIHILCYLRMFGFAFNPLTVYYCRRRGSADSDRV
jgi:DUF1365 family protein